jgi:putative nucleotidyltransferase with HDIG domain
VLGLAVTRVFVPKDAWEKSLWRHAIQVATASRELARHFPETRSDPEEAYATGLLHDVGRFVLFQEAPEELRRVDESGWDSPDGLLAAERAICGLTHAELGATACSKWGIPELITLSVLHHHAPELADLDIEVARLVALVHVADMAMFPSAVPGSPSLDEADDETLRTRVLEKLPIWLRMDTIGLRDLLRASSGEAEEMFASLKLQ